MALNRHLWLAVLLWLGAAASAATWAPDFGGDAPATGWQQPLAANVTFGDWQGVPLLQIGLRENGEPPHLQFVNTETTYADFYLDVWVRMHREGFGGIHFGDGYDIYFGGKNRLYLRHRFKVLKHLRVGQRLGAFHRLGVAVAGDRLTVAVDGEQVLDDTIETGGQPRPVSLVAHGSPVEFARLRLASAVPVSQTLRLSVPADSLIRLPGSSIAIPVTLASATPLPPALAVTATIYPAVGPNAAPHPALARRGDCLQLGSGDPLRDSQLDYLRVPLGPARRDFVLRATVQTPRANAGIGFHQSAGGFYELYATGDTTWVLRCVLPGWKPEVVATWQVTAAPEHRLVLQRLGSEIHVTIDDTVMPVITHDASLVGTVDLFVNRTTATYRDLTIAETLDGPAVWTMSAIETAPDPLISQTLPGAPQVSFRLGESLPAGFYELRLEAGNEAETVARSYPFGVWEIVPAPPARLPLIVYSKHDVSPLTSSPEAYMHALCHHLREAGVNGLTHNFRSREQLDIVGRYGLQAVLREDAIQWADHAAAAAMLIGDEPTMANLEEYGRRYREYAPRMHGKPLLTCLVGEHINTDNAADPLDIWASLRPDHRLVRFYPLRQAAFGAFEPKPGLLPAAEVYRLSREAADTPWSAVIQTFGTDASPARPAPWWRNPTGPEVSILCHLALANGAKALYFYTYQGFGSDYGMADPISFRPRDGKLAAVSAVAAFVRAHEELLLAMATSDLQVTATPAAIYARPFASGGRTCIYLVNQDPIASHEAIIALPTGEPRQALAPGQGTILILEPAP